MLDKKNKQGEVDRVYRSLSDWLVTAELRPGEFLSESDLAERLKTSRTPVREACNRLAQDKWLSQIRRKGFLVTPISVRDIVELYEYRKVLECFSVQKAASTLDNSQFEKVRQLVQVEDDKSASIDDLLAANEPFHIALAEMTGNQRVLDQMRLTLKYVRRLDTLCTQTVPGWVGHSEILSAIAQKDPVAAKQAMELHLDQSKDKMIRLFGT